MDIVSRINMLRAKIDKLVFNDDIELCGEDLVKLSQELDKLINIYYEELSK